MIKKFFILSAMIAFVAVFTSCEKEEFQPNSLQISEKTETSTLKAATAGWVMQTWDFSCYWPGYSTTKTFNIGNLGLVIGITNNSSNQIRVDWSTISTLGNVVDFGFFYVSGKGTANKTLPVNASVNRLKLDISSFNQGSASGICTVNSKY